MANLSDQLNTKLNARSGVNLGPKIRFDGNIFLKNEPDGKSFAEKLSELKIENQDDLIKEIIKQSQNGKSGEEILSALKSNPKSLELFKSAQKTLIARQETLKQQGEEIAAESSKGYVEEIAKKLKPAETLIATVGQVNSKQVEEEIARQTKQDAIVDDANNRKKQLSQWHSLAPRIMEDVKLKAVRVDIPGVEDLHTLIVKSVGTKNVRIDVVGSDATMKLIKAKQADLQRRLGKHDINLTDLRTHFSNKTKETSNV